ncbi:hypothetical protein NKH18_15065 [Streptomyces sp. M10(2022)]
MSVPPTGTGDVRTLADLLSAATDEGGTGDRAIPPEARALVGWVSAVHPTGPQR